MPTPEPPAPSVELDGDLLERFREKIERQAGLVLDASRGDSLATAVAEALVELGLDSPERLLERFSAPGSPAFEALVTRLTIRETYFFRNRPHFRALREVVLPDLFESARERRSLRVWSAGCSTGEEPYSLAMVLGDVAVAAGIDLTDWTVEVIGTDINPQVLDLARRAVYGKYSFRGVSPEEIDRYFEPVAEGHRVQERHRRLVRFRPFNLVTERLPDPTGPFHELDLIFCRNVTIYFGPETTRRLANAFHDTLREGGYLFVGHSEHSLETYRRFETHALPDAILYRRGRPGARKTEAAESPFGQALHALRSAAAKVASRPRGHGFAEVPVRQRPPSAPARESLPPSLDLAREALAEGDLDRAVAAAVALLEVQPGDADACLLLGELAADRGHGAEAEIWLRRTLELRPLDLTAHYVLALLAADRGQRGRALSELGRALYVAPDFLMGHYLAARLQRDGGDFAAAERSLRTARRICDALPEEQPVPFSEGLTVAQFRHLLGEAS